MLLSPSIAFQTSSPREAKRKLTTFDISLDILVVVDPEPTKGHPWR
jgi:hypothetical protein